MAGHVSRAQRSAFSMSLNIPNTLTVARLIMVPIFIALVLQATVPTRWAAVIVFCVAAATDWIDGRIARAQGLETDFGRLMDPVADKALTLGAFIVLSMEGLIPWWFTILVAVRELGITALRGALLKRGVVVSANAGGKLKTVLQMSFIILLLVPWEAFVDDDALTYLAYAIYSLGGAALGITLWSGLVYLWDGIRMLRNGQGAGGQAQDAAGQGDDTVDHPQVEAPAVSMPTPKRLRPPVRQIAAEDTIVEAVEVEDDDEVFVIAEEIEDLSASDSGPFPTRRQLRERSGD